MQLKTISYVVLTGLGIFFILTILFFSATLPNETSNGFIRTWKTESLVPIKEMAISVPLEKISSSTKGNFFFTVPNPQWLIMIDSSLTMMDTIGYGIQLSKYFDGNGNVIVDSPDVYLFANNIPAIFIGKLNKTSLDTIQFQTNSYTKSDIISPSRAVIRTLDKTLKKQTFQIVNTETGNVVHQSDIIKEQKLGGFESDGILKYNKATNRIYYIEYYRNRIYCMDTTLTLIYSNNTIDTTFTSTVEVGLTEINNKNKIMPSNSRTKINKECFIDDNYILIVSGLKSDNESKYSFRNNAVIDVYDIRDGKYTYSFHVPLINNDKLRSFFMENNRLLVLYKKRIAVFEFHLG